MVYRRININHFISRITPSCCYLCDQLILEPSILCPACAADLPEPGNICRRCARPLVSGRLCRHCLQRPPAVDRTICAYLYQPPVDRLIKKLKYNQSLMIAKLLGQQIASRAEQERACFPERLIPVPMHAFRYIGRGFNQAIEISKWVAIDSGVPIDYGLVYRTRHTPPQYNLNPGQRKRNVKNAFILKRTPDFKSAAIIDDIITTGATINEIARLLKLAGVDRVEAWTSASANLA